MIIRIPNNINEAMELLEGVVDLESWENLEALYGEEGLRLPWLQEAEPAHGLAAIRKVLRLVLDHLHYIDRMAAGGGRRRARRAMGPTLTAKVTAHMPRMVRRSVP